MMGLKEVFIVGHEDCGMAKQDTESILKEMINRGISKEAIDSINLDEWTGIIEDEKENVVRVVNKVKDSIFVPKDIKVHGLLIHPNTGQLEVIVDGNK